MNAGIIVRVVRYLAEWRRSRKMHEATRRAYSQFQESHPDLAGALFDWHFLTHNAEVVLKPVESAPSEQASQELAQAWADQLTVHTEGRKATFAEQVTPAIHEFVVLLRAEMACEGLATVGSQPDARVRGPVLQQSG